MQNSYRGEYPSTPPVSPWGYPPGPYPRPQLQYPRPQYPPPQYPPPQFSRQKSIVCFFIVILVIIFVLFGFVGPWLHCNKSENKVCEKSKEYGLFCEKTCLYDNYGPSAGLWFFLLMSLPL